jgi:hypothetical protein
MPGLSVDVPPKRSFQSIKAAAVQTCLGMLHILLQGVSCEVIAPCLHFFGVGHCLHQHHGLAGLHQRLQRHPQRCVTAQLSAW